MQMTSECRRGAFQSAVTEKGSGGRKITHGAKVPYSETLGISRVGLKNTRMQKLQSPHITCTYANLAAASEELELVRTGAIRMGGGGRKEGGDTVQSRGPGSNVRRFMS